MQHPNQLEQGFEYLTPEKLELIFKYLDDQSNLVQLAPSSAPPSPSEASPSPVSTPLAEPIMEPTLPPENISKVPSDARALYNMFALPLARSCESTELMSISQKSQGKVHLHNDSMSISNISSKRSKKVSQAPKAKRISRVGTSSNPATYAPILSLCPKKYRSFQAFDIGGKLIESRSLFKKKRSLKKPQVAPSHVPKPSRNSRVKVKKIPKVGPGDQTDLEWQSLLDR
ncbi:hypothetical protein DSO57_1010087 [Entomophthora muscae]|uniref:Uncharacterized protein n=1 Tax=Entomophthora muscae TaxID=34485 RepID=A0ACC2T6Q5_9FUNG|nr:hypothetical protein DSO57_1010087 [Entomophthora muscae]